MTPRPPPAPPRRGGSLTAACGAKAAALCAPLPLLPTRRPFLVWGMRWRRSRHRTKRERKKTREARRADRVSLQVFRLTSERARHTHRHTETKSGIDLGLVLEKKTVALPLPCQRGAVQVAACLWGSRHPVLFLGWLRHTEFALQGRAGRALLLLST